MASKEILKHNGNVVPEINDSSSSQFGGYEVYSRKNVDGMIAALRSQMGANDWTGEKIVFDGESITKNETTGFVAYIGEQLGCEAVSVAQSGHCVAGDYEGEPYDFRIRVSGYPADADAIVVMGDCISTLFVTSSARCGTIDSSDKTTWFGRWNLMLEAIKRSYPTVPVFLVAEFGQGVSKQETTYLVSTYFHQLARKWCCHFVDLPTESPLDLKYAYPVWGLTATDSTHASHEAMPLYADPVIRHIRLVPPPVWQGADTIAITESAVEVAVGSTVELTATKSGDLPSQWVSDNTDVACVLGGVVYGMAAGTATITATTRNGNTASCVVTVTEAAAE